MTEFFGTCDPGAFEHLAWVVLSGQRPASYQPRPKAWVDRAICCRRPTACFIRSVLVGSTLNT